MYHSIMDNPEAHNGTFGGIIHSSAVFAGQMEIVARYYNPVSLTDVLDILEGRRSLPKRAVAVTFDDGYSDNCEVAASILNRLGIPAAFYVVIDSIATGMLPWPIRVRHAFLSTRAAAWKDQAGRCWPLHNEQQRSHAFAAACDHCGRLAGLAQAGAVEEIEKQLATTPYAPEQRLMMTWEQLKTLRKQGHVVGSHTLSHPNMAQIGKEQAQQEFVESKRQLEEQLSEPVWHFSYPNPVLDPHWTEQTASTSKQAGYRTAVTASRGLVRWGDDPLQLRRILPTKQVNGLRWNLECAFAGYVR